MNVVIGGPPSVGSSVLVRILDRHSKIASGPETAIFSRMSLMEHWTRDRVLLSGRHWRKLRDHGWHRYRGTTLIDSYYPWDEEEISSLALSSHNFPAFIDRLSQRLNTAKATNIWVEKTPSNAYSFGWITQNMPDIKLILMIRHPYDAIASMMARGYDVVYATAAYLLHTSAGCTQREGQPYLIKYEDLISASVSTLTSLCGLLNVDYEPAMLSAKSPSVIMEGWLQSETSPLTDQSIGRFSSLSAAEQSAIIDCVAALKVNRSFMLPGLSWSFHNIQELSDHFGYDLLPSQSDNTKPNFTFALLKEAIIRTLKGYPTHIMNFPLSY